jgi:four helix bundle protein
MQDYQKLKVWEKAHRLAMDVYRSSEGFPKRDGVALTAQLRRAAFSIPANIAEGAGKSGNTEFRRFLDIALGSAAETHYHLMAARDIGILENHTYDDLSSRVVEVRKMLSGLIKRVRLSTAEQPQSTPSVPTAPRSPDRKHQQPTKPSVS